MSKAKTSAKAVVHHLSDYRPPLFLADTVTMDVDIQPDHARVTTVMKLFRNPDVKDQKGALVLDGIAQKLLGVKVDGRALTSKDYKLTPTDLTIPGLKNKATIEVVSTNDPYNNKTLEGFYQAGPMLNSQNEPDGFRRITYFLDRPDVMAKFRITLHGDAKKYPTLLANGNLIDSGTEPKGRHYAVWEDPFKKPCYLVALVAGKFDKVTDYFITKSGRKILLEMYVEPGKTGETGLAMAALHKSMRYDEERFGLEYDLDRFMHVATSFFNHGAMENKGLVIYNDVGVLGRPETATDATIGYIERVVAHEYFHNWTGDRITLRNWFQISLKEGLTVFREQEYCGDANSVAAERIENIRDVRLRQFAEDAGAGAHPVRPTSYMAIDNFYTMTIYDKGAEVVRMLQTLTGREGFRKGFDLYVKRHDGQAVTCDEFVAAIADANKMDAKQFMLWYSQAGTPILDVASVYDAKAKKLTLTIKQSTKPTPGQPTKKPLHIPFAIGMLDKNGKDMIGTKVLELRKAKEVFVFDKISEKPVLSLLRDFSAPVRMNYAYTDQELLFLLAHDSDAFCRWEAGFTLATKYLLLLREQFLKAARKGQKFYPPRLDTAQRALVNPLVEAFGMVLRHPKLDAAFKAMVMTLPSETELGLALQAKGELIDVDSIYAVRKALIRYIGDELKADLVAAHSVLEATAKPLGVDGDTIGRRTLKNLCLSYLAANGDEKILRIAYKQATTSKNMTDQVTALAVLIEHSAALSDKALAVFEKKWRKWPAIMDRWLALQAGAKRPDVLKTVKKLLSHPNFDIKNPNRMRALVLSFAMNQQAFHALDGKGYAFIAEMIQKVDRFNPMAAVRLTTQFQRWRDYDKPRQALMKAVLKKLAADKKLSPNSTEIVTKSLAAAG